MMKKMKLLCCSSSSSLSSSLLLGEFPSTDDRACCNTTHHIAEDILLEIFVLLPLNSIFRFKCVSKVWSSLLSNPCFINRWMKHHTSDKSLPWALFYEIHLIKSTITCTTRWSQKNAVNSEVISTQNGLSLKFLIPQVRGGRGDFLRVMDSRNGLVLLAPDNYLYQTRHIVCNPLTQNWFSLPPPPQAVKSGPTISGLVCDELFPPTCYKVVRIPNFGTRKGKFIIDIFSSDKNEWTICDVSCPEDVSWSLRESKKIVNHNGDVLWIESNNRIVAYNLNKNECRLIDLPPRQVVSDSSSFQCLDVSEGLICYARVGYEKGKCFKLSAWVLKESWELLQKDIQLNEFFVKVMKSLSFAGALCFDPLDKNVVMIGIGNYIWACNTKTKETAKLREHHNILPYDSCATMEELVSRPIALKLWPTPALWDNHTSIDLRKQ